MRWLHLTVSDLGILPLNGKDPKGLTIPIVGYNEMYIFNPEWAMLEFKRAKTPRVLYLASMTMAFLLKITLVYTNTFCVWIYAK